MKSLIAVILGGLLSAYLWDTLKKHTASHSPITTSEKTLYLKDIDPKWPKNVALHVPIILVNSQPLYKVAIDHLLKRRSQVALSTRSLLKEIIKLEILRQYLLNEQSLTKQERRLLVPCTQGNKTWLTDINRSITKILNRIVSDSSQVVNASIDQSINEQEKNDVKVTKDILILSMKRQTEQEIEWSHLETKLLTIKKKLDRQQLSFNQALNRYSISKTLKQARMKNIKSFFDGERRLPKPVLEQVFSMSIGEISRPLRFGNLIALVKVVEIVTAKKHLNHQETKAMIKDISTLIVRQKKSILKKVWSDTHLAIQREAAQYPSKLMSSSFIRLALSYDSKI